MVFWLGRMRRHFLYILHPVLAQEDEIGGENDMCFAPSCSYRDV